VLGGKASCISSDLFDILAQVALAAYDHGVAGIVLSDHGGRQLDFAHSGIEVLVEVVKHFREQRGLRFPSSKFSFFVDKGVRRATDVLTLGPQLVSQSPHS
jgi:isopentenyl diphosphate isomerase/L-lactate dehydrogenase-like FMN-dependent dehydrogenase